MTTPFLLRSPNWLGDAVMALPAVRSLRRALPDRELVVACPVGLAALWNACPAVDRVVPLVAPRHFRATVPVLRAVGAKAALLFPNSLRSGIEARLAGISTLYAFDGGARGWLLSEKGRIARRPFDLDRLHQQYDYLQLAAALGADGDPHGAAPLLRTPAAAGPSPALILCPGAAYGPAKRWPAARFAAVGRALVEQGLGPVAVLGAAADRPVAEEVAASVPGARNLAGETSAEKFLSLIAAAKLVVTNDSGAMHVAAAFGTPGVAVFGSTEPRRTGPIDPCVRIVRFHVPCSPCFLRECPLDFACMDRVTVAEVLAACHQATALSS